MSNVEPFIFPLIANCHCLAVNGRHLERPDSLVSMRTDSLLPALCRCSSCIEFVCFQTNCSPKQLVQCSFVRFGGFVLLVTRWCYTFVLILPWPLHLDTDSIDVNRSTRSTLRSRFCWSFGVFVWRKNDTLSSSDELNSPSVEKTRTENHHRFTRALLQL